MDLILQKPKRWLGIAAICVAGLQAAAALAAGQPPSRVLIVVFDQMRPEYSQRFNMKNVRELEQKGVHFTNGYLGHMASETVISHNVMVSGIFPKKMGWVDEGYRDVNNLLGKGPNTMWVTGDLTKGQFDTIVKHANYPKLADYLHAAKPGTKFIVVGQKGYAVDSIAAPSADIAVKMSGRVKHEVKNDAGVVETVCPNLRGQFRKPDGTNVPAYLVEPKCGRFYVNSDKGNDYGTLSKSPAWLYPLDGDRFVPGRNPEHLGGDAWVADAAMAMMEKENWSGMLVTLGGIDKAGHMWGAHHDKDSEPGSPDEQTHVPFAARFADQQFGRMLKKLKDLGQLDETLIVITADHGATFAHEFYGANGANAGDYNWYHGDTVNSGNYDKPLPAMKPLYDTGNVQFSYQSTAIEAWLKDNSADKKKEAARVMRKLPGVVATYWRDGDRFQLDVANDGTHSKMTPAELAWWTRHGQALVDTMAADNGPDVMAWLKDGVAYSVHGDHGSGKENDQRVPMIIWSPRIQGEKPSYAFRTVDILPTVLKAMNIPQDKPTDGKPFTLKFR